MARVAVGATTTTLAPHRRSVGIFSSAVFPAPTTRQRRFVSLMNIGKSGIFSPDNRDGGWLTSLPSSAPFPLSLLTKHLRRKFKEMMAPIGESHQQRLANGRQLAK